MSSIARAILVAVHAASFLALTNISPATTALASPLQASSPVNSSSSLLATRVVSKHTNTEIFARIPTSSPAALPLQQRVSSANSTYHKLSVSRDKIQGNAKAMKELADKDRSPPHSVDRDAVSQMQDFRTNLLEFQTTLHDLGSDKGLANYDKNNELETLLKDLFNANKDALSSVSTLVSSDPALGPVLGPIVYEIKCIIDEVLDSTENLTDGLLNAVQ